MQGWVIVIARLQACLKGLEKGEVQSAARYNRGDVMGEDVDQSDGHLVTVAAGGILVEMIANNHPGELHPSSSSVYAAKSG